ncbi:MAG: hypothetical protein ACI9YH_001913 [Colwellia sp.]|jgi:hypothetical protein
MSESLSNKQQEKICILIIKWEGKFTWKLLVKAIKHDLNIKRSRQALCTYFAIKREYDLKKQSNRGINTNNRQLLSINEADLLKKIEKLKAENTLLDNKVKTQLAYIKNILQNASQIPNIDLSDLIKQRA